MVAAIEKAIPQECSPAGKATRIRCILHVFNLVLRAIVSIFKSCKGSSTEQAANKVEDGDEPPEDDNDDDDQEDEDEEGDEDDWPTTEEQAEGFIEHGECVSARNEDPGRDTEDERIIEDAEDEIDMAMYSRSIVLLTPSWEECCLACSAFQKVMFNLIC
ncbi:hypothetical protein PQX77_002369 [Marasmius sp. AFHP31]|nr:hypothetical protein PQX77_002369 [Marasmius sp. AFHP31]